MVYARFIKTSSQMSREEESGTLLEAKFNFSGSEKMLYCYQISFQEYITHLRRQLNLKPHLPSEQSRSIEMLNKILLVLEAVHRRFLQLTKIVTVIEHPFGPC